MKMHMNKAFRSRLSQLKNSVLCKNFWLLPICLQPYARDKTLHYDSTKESLYKTQQYKTVFEWLREVDSLAL
jgi:hypothetical protein